MLVLRTNSASTIAAGGTGRHCNHHLNNIPIAIQELLYLHVQTLYTRMYMYLLYLYIGSYLYMRIHFMRVLSLHVVGVVGVGLLLPLSIASARPVLPPGWITITFRACSEP